VTCTFSVTRHLKRHIQAQHFVRRELDVGLLKALSRELPQPVSMSDWQQRNAYVPLPSV
jgi:hypothetical protein